MTPAFGRSIQAVVLVGMIGCASAAAQQGAQPVAPTGAANAEQRDKAAVRKTETAKRKAASKDEAAGGPKLDAAAAQGEVEAGINALAQGRNDGAVASLSNALSAGSLPSAQTARALYYRGVAYRRLAKPAQAISDLTSALWIKGGLNEEQRADALQQRSGAYREAGLPDQAEPPGTRQAATGKSGTAQGKTSGSTALSTVAPPAPNTATVGGGGSLFSSLFGGGTTSSASTSSTATTTASTTPAPQRAPSTASTPSAASARSLTPSSEKPTTRMVPLVTDASSSLPVGFQSFPNEVRHIEVSTAARAAPKQAAAPAADVVSRSWSDATQVKAAPAAAAPRPAPAASARGETQVAAASPAPASAPAPAARTRKAAGGSPATGSVQVMVAAVRSANEAHGLASTLQTKYARELGGRAPVVEQTTVGTLGTLYRVQVGPFASVRDTEPLCAKLKGDGMDCRVVGQ